MATMKAISILIDEVEAGIMDAMFDYPDISPDDLAPEVIRNIVRDVPDNISTYVFNHFGLEN